MALISSPIFALHKAQLGERLGLRTSGACPPFLYSSVQLAHFKQFCGRGDTTAMAFLLGKELSKKEPFGAGDGAKGRHAGVAGKARGSHGQGLADHSRSIHLRRRSSRKRRRTHC